MIKYIALFSCAVVSLAAAVAAPLSTSIEKWDANPVAWAFRDGTVECGSYGGFAISLESPRASKAEISAKIAPASAGTNCWSTLGVALVDDERNYWHLALVQAPPENGGKRFFELAEEHDGRWNAHFDDKLRRELHEDHGAWRFDETYSFKLVTDGAGIQGEVRDSAGKLLFLRRYAFPVPDANGSVAAVTCGRPALHATGRFRGTVSALDAACSDVRPDAAQSPVFPPYNSDSFVPGVKEKATGFFCVVQRPDGRWWAIDPLGRGVVLMGVDHVSYNGVWSQRTKRSDYHEANKKKFPDKRDWEADTLKRLKSWGFNMLGAGCETSLERRGLIHTRFLSMGDALCRNEQDDALWICPSEHCPCSAFPNVFDPLFPAYCDYVARHRCAPNRDDPWLFGYFIDNELAWWGRGARDTGLYDAVMKKSETHSAKIALRAFLKERGVTGEPSAKEKLDFLRLAAERYFSCAASAIRRHDPDHLVLGARFAGVDGAHDVVWEVAGRHCDVVTFNFYPWADIDRNAAFLLRRGANAPLATDVFAERYAIAKRPMFVTEWSFPALDSGLPCKYGAGQRFRTQKERAAASELFAKTMLATPSVLGYDYFMWVDQPAEGMSDDFPEDSNYGLVNLKGEAYPEITSMFAAVQKEAGRWRNAPVPSMRPAPPSSATTAASFARRLPAPSAPGGVAYERKGDDYTVATRGGLVLSGRVGGKEVFSRVSLKGVDLGSYNTMLCHRTGGIQRWANIAKVTSVAFVERKGWGLLAVVGENRADGDRHSFEISQKIAIHPDKPYFLCDIEKVSNVGAEPLDMCSFLFRQHAPYAAERMETGRAVPNLWKEPLRDAWLRASDGAWWGGLSASPACTAFHYFLSKDGGKVTQHPDACFEPVCVPPAGSPKGCWRLAPGDALAPHGTVWMLCIGGTGGRGGWKRQIRALTEEASIGRLLTAGTSFR